MSSRSSNRIRERNRQNDQESDSESQNNNQLPELEEALTPGTAIKGTLKYGIKSHFYIYSGATEKLEEELYDCSPDGFFQFIKSLKERANEFGWTKHPSGIMWVEPKPGEEPINILDHYGSISLERIQQHELTYFDKDEVDRQSQDDRMLYECIMASLSPTGKSKINMHSNEYMLGDKQLPSGLALFKVVVRESYLDSNATTGMIREKLSALDLYMPTIGNDIIKFNNHVRMLLGALDARGARTFDLLTNLFKAYAVCADEKFIKYIEDLQNDHDDGTKPLTAPKLMLKAENKYKIMKTRETWEAPTAVDERIIALQATIQSMQNKLSNGKKKRKNDEGKSENDNSSNKKRKQSKKEKKKQEKPEWMSKPPSKDELKKPRRWNGKNWHWCSHETGGKCNGAWRVHKPSECKGKAYLANKRDSKEKNEKEVVLQEAIDSLAGGYESE